MDRMPVPTELALLGEWPGIEVRSTGNGKYVLFTVTEGASWEDLLAAHAAHAVGLRLHRVTDAGELVYQRPSTLEWRSAVDEMP